MNFRYEIPETATKPAIAAFLQQGISLAQKSEHTGCSKSFSLEFMAKVALAKMMASQKVVIPTKHVPTFVGSEKQAVAKSSNILLCHNGIWATASQDLTPTLHLITLKRGEDISMVPRAKAIKMIMTDVDGVLTDGKLIYGNENVEYKAFDVKDGLGIRLAHQAGLKTAIITGRASLCLQQRAAELAITALYQNVLVKQKLLPEILAKYQLSATEVAYIGDDLLDLPLMKQVGLAVAVADAVSEVKEAAHYVTEKTGGHGAVREVIELVLKAQERWQVVIKECLTPSDG